DGDPARPGEDRRCRQRGGDPARGGTRGVPVLRPWRGEQVCTRSEWSPGGRVSHRTTNKGPAPAAQALSFGGSVLRLPPVLSRQVGVGGVVLGLLVAHLGTLRTVPGSWSGVVVLMESSFLPGPSAHVRPRVVRHVFAQVGLTDQDLRACVRVSTGVPGASQVDAALG